MNNHFYNKTWPRGDMVADGIVRWLNDVNAIASLKSRGGTTS